MDQQKIINSIKERILAEQRKHPDLDWALIAANKIYNAHFKEPEPSSTRYFIIHYYYATNGADGNGNMIITSEGMPSRHFITETAINQINKEYNYSKNNIQIVTTNITELSKQDYTDYIAPNPKQ